MLALSQTAGYAILALSDMAEDGEQWALAGEIAQRTGVPRPYLSKILHALVKAQLLKAKRGYRGGFRLARPKRQIRVLDVVEAVDGQAWASRCLLGLEVCSDERACPTHEFWKAARGGIADCLARLSLSDVARHEEARRQLATPSGPVRAELTIRRDKKRGRSE